MVVLLFRSKVINRRVGHEGLGVHELPGTGCGSEVCHNICGGIKRGRMRQRCRGIVTEELVFLPRDQVRHSDCPMERDGLLVQPDVWLLLSVHCQRHRQRTVYCQPTDRQAICDVGIKTRVHLVPTKTRLGVLAIAHHVYTVVERVDRSVVRLQILVTGVKDPVVVVNCRVVQRVIRKEPKHRLHVIANSTVWTAAIVRACAAISLAQGKPNDATSTCEVCLQPSLEGVRLGSGLRVVEFVEVSFELGCGVGDVGWHDFKTQGGIAMHVVCNSRLVTISFADKILRDPSSS
mmetsp:Transcript_35268/g.69195  ORF Transcript_35268/g.69195 Transcript_35268/m.69195 type:complete len:291 (+) Transcript_35268:73-945(+)